MLLFLIEQALAEAGSAKDFYVYRHRRLTDGEVFYVGKGRGSRGWSRSDRNNRWHEIASTHGFRCEIVVDGLQEWAAFELEKDLIALHGRNHLCNRSDGGDGPSGHIHSSETRARISLAKKGQTGRLGAKLSETTRAKIAAKARGRISPTRGLQHSDTARAKMSAAAKERPSNRLGTTQSEQSRARNAESQRTKQPVQCSNGMQFPSSRAAARWLREQGHQRASNGSISKCCSGASKQAYGFTWAYVKVNP